MTVSFVLGFELLLLLLYVRTSFNYLIKKRIFFTTSGLFDAATPLMEDIPKVNLPCAVGHAKVMNLHQALCLDTYKNAPLLAVLCYILAASLFVLLVNSPSPQDAYYFPGVETSLTAAAGGLSVFLLAQWLIVKLVVFKTYEEMYNRSTGAVSKVETVALTFAALAPSLVSVFAFAAFAFAWFRVVDWWVVALTCGASLVGLSTEAFVFSLMKGLTASAGEIASATANTGIAVLWVNAGNPPAYARKALAETMFPHGEDGSVLPLGITTGLRHFYHDNFVTSYLQVSDSGALVVRRDRAFPISVIVMIACAVCLIAAPIAAIAFRAPALDAAILAVQFGMICAAFAIYVFTSKHSVPLDGS
jgi:hypothetical protein